MPSEEKRRPNKWFVLTIVYVILLVQHGLMFAIGATFVALLDKYQHGRSRTSIMQSLFLGLGLGLGVVAGLLVDRIGLLYMSIISSVLCPFGFIISFYSTSIEFLYISIGVISGTGLSFANMCSSTTLVRAFAGKQLALSLSIAYSAPALSGGLYPYFIDWSLKTYGLNGTWLLIGGLYLHSWSLSLLIMLNRQTFETNSSNKLTVPVGGFNKSIKQQNPLKEDVTCGKCGFFRNYISIFQNRSFTFLLAAVCFTSGGINGYISLLFDIAAWKTFSSSQTLLLFLPYSVCNMVSRILSGLIKQKRGINSYIYPIILTSLGIIALFINNYTINFGIFVCGISLIGLAKGGPTTTAQFLLTKLVEEEHITVASGLLFTVAGIFSTASGPFFGAIRDISGSYELVGFATVVILSAGLVCFIISLVLRKMANNDKQSINEIHDTVIYVTNDLVVK